VRLQRMTSATGALLCGQDTIGIDLRLEPREEGGSTGPSGRSALSVQRMGSRSSAQGSFGGGKRKRHRRFPFNLFPPERSSRDRWRPRSAAICPKVDYEVRLL